MPKRPAIWTVAGSRNRLAAVVAIGCAFTVAAACDGGSGAGPTSSSPRPTVSTSASSSSSSQPPPHDGVEVGSNPSTWLKVDAWGATKDGLISVIVSNVGDATVRSARAIIAAKDKFGNVVAAISAPPGTALGTRCCTIIGLAPGHRYGIYSDIGTRLSRVKSVSVQYASVRTERSSVTSPVKSMTHATLKRRGSTQVDVYVTVNMAKKVGPYITVQAFLDGPDKKFLGVISSGFYCLEANTSRRIKLQFFHPVPAGTSVESVLSYPLDSTTAKLEKLRSCPAH